MSYRCSDWNLMNMKKGIWEKIILYEWEEKKEIVGGNG